jgi:cytochrome c oxidase subunit 2
MATAIAVLAATAATPAFAASGLSPIVPNGVSPNGQAIHWLYLFISPFAAFIFLLVEGLLITIIIKYRRSRLPADYKPPQWHGNTKLEIAWTIGPALILACVGYFSFRTLQTDFVEPANAAGDVNIHIVAHRYGWDYEYSNGVKVDSEGLAAADDPMVIPANTMVRIRLDSIDVIHSFWVPDITGKTDAVPGYSNYTWMKVDQTGEWRGECAELCGPGHATMQIRVKAVTPAQYQAWLSQQKKKGSASTDSATVTPKPSPSPSPSPSPTASPTPSS